MRGSGMAINWKLCRDTTLAKDGGPELAMEKPRSCGKLSYRYGICHISDGLEASLRFETYDNTSTPEHTIA